MKIKLEKIILKTPEGESYTKNFSIDELRCRCPFCNKEYPHRLTDRALALHQELRTRLQRRYTPNSAYRCELHEEERDKASPGEHNRTAMDIPVYNGLQRAAVVSIAIELGAGGIGVANGFVHVDWREGPLVLWKY